MTFIAKPLYLAAALHGRARHRNWGWAIILSTVIFNLALLPTRFMMTKSSLKMMRIQPKVDAIKKRYANLKATDPKRAEMNTEMMALYKTEGVNMYGSCLPMLVQMPLFCGLLPRAANTRSSCARRTGSGCPISRSPTRRTFCPSSSSSPCSSRSTSRLRRAWIPRSGA